MEALRKTVVVSSAKLYMSVAVAEQIHTEFCTGELALKIWK